MVKRQYLASSEKRRKDLWKKWRPGSAKPEQQKGTQGIGLEQQGGTMKKPIPPDAKGLQALKERPDVVKKMGFMRKAAKL